MNFFIYQTITHLNKTVSVKIAKYRDPKTRMTPVRDPEIISWDENK